MAKKFPETLRVEKGFSRTATAKNWGGSSGGRTPPTHSHITGFKGAVNNPAPSLTFTRPLDKDVPKPGVR